MSRIAIKNERELARPSRQAAANLSVETGNKGFFDLTAAIEAGKAQVEGLGKLIAAHVIPRPSDAVLSLLPPAIAK